MPPLELGTAAGIAKYAPVLFLSVSPKGVSVNWAQQSHTLLVSAIVAGVTMYGTQQVMDSKLKRMEQDIARLNVMAEEAIRVQREIVPMRNLQVKILQEGVKDLDTRMKVVERRR